MLETAPPWCKNYEFSIHISGILLLYAEDIQFSITVGVTLRNDNRRKRNLTTCWSHQYMLEPLRPSPHLSLKNRSYSLKTLCRRTLSLCLDFIEIYLCSLVRVFIWSSIVSHSFQIHTYTCLAKGDALNLT